MSAAEHDMLIQLIREARGLANQLDGQVVNMQTLSALKDLLNRLDHGLHLIQQPDYEPPSGSKVCDKCGQPIK
jgi:hypothetical protein